MSRDAPSTAFSQQVPEQGHRRDQYPDEDHMIEDLTAGFTFAFVVVHWVSHRKRSLSCIKYYTRVGCNACTKQPVLRGWLIGVTEPLPESCNVPIP